MKASLLALSLLAITTSVQAHENMWTENGYPNNGVVTTSNAGALGNNEKDIKIATLSKLLEQQQRLYEEKIIYLEEELKKSKDRLVEKSINHDKMQAFQERNFSEESSFLKKELVAKTKTLMEYQRQLEKIKPTEEVKNLIKINTDLAIELRKTTDQIALMHLKGDALATKPLDTAATGGRMPASSNHGK
ncbi:MAG: hypothetical protein K2Q18_07985 [Bdellovibrionales bacterium]|nr:hypothetical protein [Bdellovibrionales bacterium]